MLTSLCKVNARRTRTFRALRLASELCRTFALCLRNTFHPNIKVHTSGDNACVYSKSPIEWKILVYQKPDSRLIIPNGNLVHKGRGGAGQMVLEVGRWRDGKSANASNSLGPGDREESTSPSPSETTDVLRPVFQLQGALYPHHLPGSTP